MKKIRLFTGCILLTCFYACEDFLDPKIDNSYGDDITWTLPGYAQGVLYNAYANITQVNCAYNNNNYLDVITDNAVTNDYTSSLYKFISGGQSATNEPFGEWGTAYNQFRNIHLFLENGLGDNIKYDLFNETIDAQTRKRLRGEAYFLRAWWGMYLLQIYGGVTDDGMALGYPIVTRSFTEKDKEYANSMPRNTYDECVRQIIADCDSAIKYLPMKYTGSDGIAGEAQIGRGDGRTAFSIKSRATIYAASPAYQPANATPEQIVAKWERAAIYAQKAIDSTALGAYTALTGSMIVGTDAEKNYNDELLLRKWWYNPTQEQHHFPPLFFGQGKTNPSQNLVNAYPMRNGYPITDPRSGYLPQNPYTNRDNRFGFTIYYNGATFNSARPMEIYTTVDGYKGRDVEGYDYRNTRTGYYLRKGMSTIKNFLYTENLTTSNDYHQRGIIRRAEMYYNLAEAMNRLYGPKGTGIATDCYGNDIALTRSAFDIIKNIRSKNGITGGDPYLDEVAAAGTEAFHNLIMNERRIEFAFENHRFFDLRRWKIPLNIDILGCRILKDGASLYFSGCDPETDNIVVEKRNLLQSEKYFYTPVPYSEIMKNKNLKQNKGW